MRRRPALGSGTAASYWRAIARRTGIYVVEREGADNADRDTGLPVLRLSRQGLVRYGPGAERIRQRFWL
jgi:hypothetical protein